MRTNKTFGYYFLNKKLHPPIPKNYKSSIILTIINKNNTLNKNKMLFVQQKNLIWNLPKKGIKTNSVIEDIYTTVSNNLENELGFKGIKVTETKPTFKQVAFIFDFDKQVYDEKRSIQEKRKDNPTTGKIYQLAIMEYHGPDKIPLTSNSEVVNYKWVNITEGKNIMGKNKELLAPEIADSKESIDFNIKLFGKILNTYEMIETIFKNKKQFELF